MIGIVIPAFDEEARIGSCLQVLTDGVAADEFDVVVVPNGCRDRTADIARSFGPPVRVVELERASKISALNAGDDALGDTFPRAYLDGDTEVRADQIRHLAAALRDRSLLLVAPARRLDVQRASPFVRSYLRIWEALPNVVTAPTGTGLLMVSALGRRRFDRFPEVIADDRYLVSRFAPHERAVIEQVHVALEAPRTLRALFRRRLRVAGSHQELDRVARGIAPARRTAGLVTVVARDPRRLVDLPLFVLVTLVAEVLTRVGRGRRRKWERDETTRGPRGSSP